MNDRQLGRFSIPEAMLRRNPDEVAQIFGLLKIVPVRAEDLFHGCEIEYFAIGEQFEEVPIGRVIPKYVIEVEKDDEGNVISANAIKQQDPGFYGVSLITKEPENIKNKIVRNMVDNMVIAPKEN